MDDKKKVTLTSMCKHEITISFPELHIIRHFPTKGAKIKFDADIFMEMAYDPGLMYMLENGMLFLDDMDIKKELGLEPEDAVEPENIVILSDKDIKRYLTVMPVGEFKKTLKKLKKEQIDSVIDYAIENEIVDMERCDFLKKMTGRDIIRAIQLNRDSKIPPTEDKE